MTRDLPVLRPLNIPLVLFVLTLSLVATGIIAVYSASASQELLVRQSIYALGGLVLLLAAYWIDYGRLKRLAPWLLGFSMLLLLLIYVPGIGVSAKGDARWINLGIINFQPSELAKLAMIIYMAKMLSERRPYIRSFCSGVMPALVVTGLFAAVIVKNDFGATFVLCVVVCGMWLVAEMRWFHLLALGMAVLPALVMAILMRPHRVSRVFSYLVFLLTPELVDQEMRRGSLYQLSQSLIAIGSGGMWGRGLGESLQKFGHLPDRHTDFIFAIMAEELGFVRVSLVVAAYAAIVLLGWIVALRSTDLFGSLLASGITLLVFANAAINLGVVLGLLPTKGLTLPFISYGGSSLLICMTAMGILMNVARTQLVHQRWGS